MPASVSVTFALIVLARIADVTLDTLRTASIVQGRRVFAATLGFVQALIFILAVAKVIGNTEHPIYAVAYALGYCLGTFLGITLEQRLAFGYQVASLFTRQGARLSEALVKAGYRLAAVQGHVQDGDITILHVEVARKNVRRLIHDAALVDQGCFCIVNDVRSPGFRAGSLTQ